MCSYTVYIQYRSKVSYHLSSCFSRDVSRSSRDASRFSRESLMRLVWHILRIRNRTCVTVAALQFVGKSMGPSNIRYALVLYLHKLHVQYCAKVTQAKFDEFLGFSWLFEEISLQTKFPRLFRELSRHLLFYSSRTFER